MKEWLKEFFGDIYDDWGDIFKILVAIAILTAIIGGINWLEKMCG